MGDFWTAVGAVGALVAAIAASFAGYFTYRIMQAGQKQVAISQMQNQQTLEAERDAQLPVLMPVAPLFTAGYGSGAEVPPPRIGYDRTQPFARVAIKNVGSGIALNIWGIVFEPEPSVPVHKVTGQHHSHRYDLPLESGDTKQVDWRGGGLALSGDTTFTNEQKQYSLYAPAKPTFADVTHGEVEKVARLTLTYTDIFGRKHAAIYDFTAQMEWESIAYLRNISQGLGELEHAAMSSRSILVSPRLPTIHE